MGRRWNGGVLLALGCGAERFSEVLRAVPGLSDRMLAARLKELETHGAIVRTVTPTVPVQVRYRLSPYGEKLLDAVLPLIEVGRAMGQARAETLERRSA